MPENPFVFGNPIDVSDPIVGRLFCGRDSYIEQIVGRLKTMQSTSVVGERRIGKTSLLCYLSDPSEMAKRGLTPDQHVFLYFSFEGTQNITPTRFWENMLEVLSEQIEDEEITAEIETIQQQKEINAFDVQRLFRRIKRKKIRIVFLFDEFDYVTQTVNLDVDFFSSLRNLVSRPTQFSLVLVTSSWRKLSEISHSGVAGSPFFNIFATVSLKPFNESDACQLIHVALSENSVSFDEKEVEFLIEMTGCYPFFFQMGCSYLYDAYTIEGLTGDDKREERLKTVKEKCIEQAEPHFEYYWSKSPEPERILLTTIAVLGHAEPMERRFDMGNLKRCYQESESIISGLEERGLVLEKDGQYRIFSPMFKDWIIGEIINRKPPAQDYEEWLQNNEGYFGSIKKLYGHAKEITARIKPEHWSMITKWLSKSENWKKILGWIAKAGAAIGLGTALL